MWKTAAFALNGVRRAAEKAAHLTGLFDLLPTCPVQVISQFFVTSNYFAGLSGIIAWSIVYDHPKPKYFVTRNDAEIASFHVIKIDNVKFSPAKGWSICLGLRCQFGRLIQYWHIVIWKRCSTLWNKRYCAIPDKRYAEYTNYWVA